MKEDLVWYVSYGSNMLRERFMCYIEGGICKENGAKYNGCEDKTPPRDNKPYLIKNYRMYFGKESQKWDNGGVSFLEEKEGAETRGRMYLITWEQFCDVRCQEGCGGEWYCDRVRLNPEKPEDIPIYTITNKKKRPVKPPSKKYLDVVARGLKETFGDQLSPKEIDEYLELCMK